MWLGGCDQLLGDAIFRLIGCPFQLTADDSDYMVTDFPMSSSGKIERNV